MWGPRRSLTWSGLLPSSCFAPLPAGLLCDPFPLTMESGLGLKHTIPQGGFSSSWLCKYLRDSLWEAFPLRVIWEMKCRALLRKEPLFEVKSWRSGNGGRCVLLHL